MNKWIPNDEIVNKFEELKIITFTPNVKPLFKVSAKRLSLELDDMIKHKI